MKRAEARDLRSQTAVAEKRAAETTAEGRARVEWDAVRARIKRMSDPGERDAAWGRLASRLAEFGHG